MDEKSLWERLWASKTYCFVIGLFATLGAIELAKGSLDYLRSQNLKLQVGGVLGLLVVAYFPFSLTSVLLKLFKNGETGSHSSGKANHTDER